MRTKFNRTARYVTLLGVFLLVMSFYAVMLAKIQIDGPTTTPSDKSVAYTRTVSVSGLRGEIYDRNGVLLVGNSTSYDLVFEYGSIPDTTAQLNRSILAALEAVEACGSSDKLCLDLYALEGSYPDLYYSDAVASENSDEYRALVKILEANSLDVSNTSAEELVKRLVNKYKLSPDLYSNEEIDALLRVRYTMERIKFGAYQPLVLASGISMELVSYVEEANIDGINLKVNSSREFKFPGYASHILGRLGKITAENADHYSELGYPMDAYVGSSGCEKAFENYLRSQDGIMEIRYDSDGNIISKEFIKEPISGNDVYLTIDIELQIATEDALKKSVDSILSSNSGAALSLTPSGEILSIASYPTYDLSQFDSVDYYNSLLQDPATPLLDRALLGQYAPGSTYKVGSAIAALEEGTLSSATRLNCSGVYPHLHNPTCLGVHGSINVVEAIGVSCNCFFYEIGMLMGIDKVTPYTSRLGLGAPTGIELPERAGIVAGSAYREQLGTTWGKGDDLSAAIGQSDHSYTPLQIGVYLSSVLNGGDRYGAHLLHSVKKFYTQETVYEHSPKLLDSIDLSPSTLSTVKSGMRQVVSQSSTLSSYFASIGETVAGKTGTAEVGGKNDYALFMGFAPFDSPEIIGVCVLEEGVYGANAAIPVRDIFKEYFRDRE